MSLWKVPSEVSDLSKELIEQNHPHLSMAKIAISFDDSKVFKQGQFNWGKVSKASKIGRLWQPSEYKYDFYVILCSGAWNDFLTESQKKAWLDLCLTRCQVEYIPVMEEKGNKTVAVKDEWGRVEYSDAIKCDEDDNPIWKVAGLDIEVIASNIKRFGLWHEELTNLESAIKSNNVSEN